MRRIRKRSEPVHFTNWKQTFRTVNGREPEYDDLHGTGEYGKLRRTLLQEQGYICCYCEKQIGVGTETDCDIEHFMPRHPDQRELTAAECKKCRDAQLDYTNMMVSCKGEEAYSVDHCNHKKDNWFDFRFCVSPVSEEIVGLFGYRPHGKIFAINNDQRAEEMKRHLNLDTYVLQEQRKAAFDTVLEQEFGDNDELWMDDQYIADTISFYNEMDDKGRYAPFCSMITYCLEHY
jgi:uncharacterized protein (TIGR02646 family)